MAEGKRIMDAFDPAAFEADFEREIVKDDDSAARDMLLAGRPIHVSREDTPAGHVVRIHPNGREEIVRVDREALAKVLGR